MWNSINNPLGLSHFPPFLLQAFRLFVRSDALWFSIDVLIRFTSKTHLHANIFVIIFMIGLNIARLLFEMFIAWVSFLFEIKYFMTIVNKGHGIRGIQGHYDCYGLIIYQANHCERAIWQICPFKLLTNFPSFNCCWSMADIG